LDGIDPIDAKRAALAASALVAAKAISFEQAAQQYFDAHEKQWKNAKHRAQFLSTLRAYAYPVIGKLSVADVDLGLVLKIIEPIWEAKTETASRVRGRIETVLDWATVRGFRSGENPARWKGHIEHVLPARDRIAKKNHHAALPYIALPAFMSELRKREGVAAKALEFTILTAARTGEVTGATWDEINFAERTWTIPAGRIKGGREHKVPLSAEALHILRSIPTEASNKFVFIGMRTGGISNMAMASVLSRMDRKDVTVHGFRSTFRDWAAERTNYPNHVVEMALAHVIGNKVEAAYRRGDLFEKRARLMADWSMYCYNPKISAVSEIVVPIRGQSA
jgi:integrase